MVHHLFADLAVAARMCGAARRLTELRRVTRGHALVAPGVLFDSPS
jgi:hypothetical protein